MDPKTADHSQRYRALICLPSSLRVAPSEYATFDFLALAPADAAHALITVYFTRNNLSFEPNPSEAAYWPPCIHTRNAEICRPQTANTSTDSLENTENAD